MAQSVRERTEEIGVLKAMGFTHVQVLFLVLGESCFLAAFGGAAGLTAAWFLIARGDPTGGALPIFFFPVGNLAWGVVLIFALGLTAGALPAWQAMRLQIAEALRKS
jgi:putative ABC transport system permease protein